MNQNRELVLKTLDGLCIPYQLYEHRPANTMEDCDEIDRQAGITATHCKNLFLCNRQSTRFYLLLIRGDKMFKTSEVSKQLGVSRLSFGKEDKLLEYLGVTPGAVSPLGLLFDKGNSVTLLMDQSLLLSESICLHPCENTSSVVLSTQDFMEKFLKHVGHRATFLTIPEPPATESVE